MIVESSDLNQVWVGCIGIIGSKYLILDNIVIFMTDILPMMDSWGFIQRWRSSSVELRREVKLRPKKADSFGEIFFLKYVISLVQRGIGDVWAATSQLLEFNGWIADLF